MKLGDVEVHIIGAGLMINYPTEVIIKALKEAGFKVEVDDPHPAENPEELIEWQKVYIKNNDITLNCKVVAKHIPWGG